MPVQITTIIWAIAGLTLSLMELILPTAFVELMMGISALIVAAFSLIVPNVNVQVALWLILSLTFIILARRFLAPKPNLAVIEEEREAETLTEILPGETGRVLYEGNSWRAKCADEKKAIASSQRVYIVSRQGNTLIVLPYDMLD